jgi:hypothetical protein
MNNKFLFVFEAFKNKIDIFIVIAAENLIYNIIFEHIKAVETLITTKYISCIIV